MFHVFDCTELNTNAVNNIVVAVKTPKICDNLTKKMVQLSSHYTDVRQIFYQLAVPIFYSYIICFTNYSQAKLSTASVTASYQFSHK